MTSRDEDLARMVAWGKARNLTVAQPFNRCFHWLTRGRCAVAICRHSRTMCTWMDHVSAWKYEGKPAMLVCQPYHLFGSEMRDLLALAQEYDVEINVHGVGFYGFGTICIELHSPGYTKAVQAKWKVSA